MIRRIFDLLEPSEKKDGVKVTLSIFVVALLDFVGLASLLPVLYYLLEGGENKKAALYFALLAIGVILFKSLVTAVLARYQSRYLFGIYK